MDALSASLYTCISRQIICKDINVSFCVYIPPVGMHEMLLYIYIYIYIYMYVCMYVCMYVYIYTIIRVFPGRWGSNTKAKKAACIPAVGKRETLLCLLSYMHIHKTYINVSFWLCTPAAGKREMLLYFAAERMTSSPTDFGARMRLGYVGHTLKSLFTWLIRHLYSCVCV